MPLAIADPRDRIIAALDVASVAAARDLIERLGDAVSFYKIGYQLGYAGGFELIDDLRRAGKRVFLDLKLLDIDNTVAHGVASLSRLGADFLTVHAYPKTMQAAAEASRETKTTILGVTVLTSMSDADLKDAGYAMSAEELVLRRARQAVEAGIGGLVCSPLEAARIRADIGDKLALVTPGIRPAGSAAGDQSRIATPADAVRAGADYLVIGRPISAADDPRAAALAIGEEIAGAA